MSGSVVFFDAEEFAFGDFVGEVDGWRSLAWEFDCPAATETFVFGDFVGVLEVLVSLVGGSNEFVAVTWEVDWPSVCWCLGILYPVIFFVNFVGVFKEFIIVLGGSRCSGR